MTVGVILLTRTNKQKNSQRRGQSELPRPIPWNQTMDVHRGYTLITWVIT